MIFNQTYFQSGLLWIGLLTTIFIPNFSNAGVPLDRIVAIVEDDVVMQSELENKLRTIRDQLRQQGTQPPPASALERQILNQLVLTKLQLQLAERTGIKVDDETLNNTVKGIAESNKISLAQFREILEKDGYNYDQFREDIRNEMIVSQLRQRHIENRVSVTDREIDNFLTTQEVQGEQEAEYRLSHILIATPEDATQEMVEQTKLVAQKVLADLQEGQDFAELAASVSDGQQAIKGGDLGWRKRSQIPTLFNEYIDDLKEGDISNLIQSNSGFHIIKITGLRSSEKHIVTQTHARHILIQTNEIITDEDAETRLKQLLLRLEGGEDFSILAQAHSEDTVSAAKGGDLGWVNPGDLVQKFEEEMNKLKPGDTSQPFQSQFGWHIVQVLERREYDNTVDSKRGRAREIIRKRKIEEAQQNWLREMREEAFVEYRLDDY